MIIDCFSTTVCWIVLAVGLVFTMLSARNSEEGESSEMMGSLLLILSGLMLVAMAGDLILMFVALELISIPTYVLLFLGRGERVLESGTKYFFLSVLASALLLYGFSFLYGAAGSTSLQNIRDVLLDDGGARRGVTAFASLALVFIFAGLGFRFTVVPFHFYAPDVYQGTTNPNAGLLAVVPKIAALVGAGAVGGVCHAGAGTAGMATGAGLGDGHDDSGQRAGAVADEPAAADGLLVDCACRLHADRSGRGLRRGQRRSASRRISMASARGSSICWSTRLPRPARLPRWSIWAESRTKSTRSRSSPVCRRYFPRRPALVAIFMFSLTGLPPLAGFWGKFTLFTGALGVDARDPSGSSLWPWFLALAIVGAVNAAISAAYYLRIVAMMYFRPPSLAPVARGGSGAACAMVLARCWWWASVVTQARWWLKRTGRPKACARRARSRELCRKPPAKTLPPT